MKGDWERTDWNASQNIKTTTGREGGKFYIKREQMNVAAVARRCQEYRKAAEMGQVGTHPTRNFATLGPL